MKKRCYYEILDVDRKATVSDIKQSYRKMALKYHPDKNDGQEAKQMFIQIQEAYQVLSDPNQRTWYDNNRQKILFDKDSMTKEDLQMHTFGFNIWEYFSPSCYKGYEQSDEKNFYKVYRQVFERIKQSQRQAYQYENQNDEQLRIFQGFGVNITPIQKVLKFYQDWDNMTTYKSFVWKQQWDTKQAPNRQIRRGMERQNKKERQKEKKFYIKTIKDLICYLKKRDPRYQNYLMEQNEKQKQKEQKKKLRLEEEKRFKEEQKEVKKQLEEQRLREVEEYYKQQGVEKEQSQEQKNNIEPVHEEEFYCEICQKGFKSQNQLKNHNNSKIHKQNLKALMSEVVLDSDKKQLQKQIIKSFQPQVKPKPQKASNPKQDNLSKQNKEDTQQKSSPAKNKKKKNKKRKEYELSSEQQPQIVQPVVQVKKVQVKKKQQSEQESSEDDFMSAMLKNRGKNNKQANIQTQGIDESDQQKKQTKGKKNNKKKDFDDEQQKQQVVEKTLGKAKQKRLKKLQREEEQKDKFKCTVCKQLFPSKTKLFTHINESGHAAAKK